MDNSKIEWCHHTANLWHGCNEVHAGCDHCYAKIMNNRYHKQNPHWGREAPRLYIQKTLGDFDRYQRDAYAKKEIQRVFVGSMMDVAEKSSPMVNGKNELLNLTTGQLREQYYTFIVPATPNLLHLLLSKRPGKYNKQMPGQWTINGAPNNIMFGASISDQLTAKTLVPQLLQVKGWRFLSVEPMLGHINLTPWLHGIDWVIVGGESGPGRRPFDLEWARDLRDQCKENAVPFFFKQIDKVNKDIPADLMVREFPTTYKLNTK